MLRVNVKNEKPLQRIDRIFHTVTTTDDPVIRKLVKSEPKASPIICCLMLMLFLFIVYKFFLPSDLSIFLIENVVPQFLAVPLPYLVPSANS